MAQAAAAARPEFKGNVAFVPTHNFVRAPEDSPNPGHGHHEFGNAETYFLVGEALGQHIPKGYIYFSMAFAFGVEMLNLRLRSKTKAPPVELHQSIR